MTKKDYELIASVLNNAMINASNGTEDDIEFVTGICNDMADELEPTNKYFDRNRFLQACGVEV